MKKDKIIVYVFLTIICIATFFDLFLPIVTIQKYILTAFLLLYTIIVLKIIKPKRVDSVGKKKVIALVISLSALYIILLYFVGIFTGFHKNSIEFSYEQLSNTILPYIIIVICSEIIRQIFITKNDIKITVITTIVLIIVEIITYIEFYNVWALSVIIEFVGYVILPAVSTSILCNYMVKRYGIISNILFRLLTTIYIFCIGFLPNIYIFFESVYRIIYPYIIYIIIDNYFVKKDFEKSIKNKKISWISFLITTSIAAIIIMLISCKFKYGILVVGSSSMTGTIDKGDAIIYERYEKQQLKEGQIIIFIKNDVKTVHRIEKLLIRNDEKIYITKGTNNEQQDEGYRTDKDIIGVVKFRIIDIGWPTIWLNELFEN